MKNLIKIYSEIFYMTGRVIILISVKIRVNVIPMAGQSISKRKWYPTATHLAYFPIILGFSHITFYALIYSSSNTLDYSSRYQQSITSTNSF